jgi:hypothetical protein
MRISVRIFERKTGTETASKTTPECTLKQRRGGLSEARFRAPFCVVAQRFRAHDSRTQTRAKKGRIPMRKKARFGAQKRR